MKLYIDPANDAPGVQNGPVPGDISYHVLTMGKTYKNLLLRNHESQSFYIFVYTCKCSIILFLNPATCAPGVYTGRTPGQGSLAPVQVKLSRSGERLQDHLSSGNQQFKTTAVSRNNH